MERLVRHAVSTAVGEVEFAATDGAVIAATLGKMDGFDTACERWESTHPEAMRPSATFISVVSGAIKAYFDGNVDGLAELPCDPEVPQASKRALEAMRSIRAGETRAYSEIAADLGYGRLGARFIGSVAARNPIALVIPCHRVVGKNGALVGYGGSLGVKEWLLEWERQHAAR